MPNLQDLRRLKFTKQLVQAKTTTEWMYKYTRIATKGERFSDIQPEMSTFGEPSSRAEDWSPSLPSSLLSLEPSSSESLDSSSSVEDSGGAVPFPPFSSSIS
jgi:hypothetical protein